MTLKTLENKKCPTCNIGVLHKIVQDENIEYFGKSILLKMPIYVCSYCKEELFNPHEEDSKKMDRLLDSFIKLVEQKLEISGNLKREILGGSTRGKVLRAIQKERLFQESKYGKNEENPKSLKEWMDIIVSELDEAIEELETGKNENLVAEILQVASVCVACLEEHGINPNFREKENEY